VARRILRLDLNRDDAGLFPLAGKFKRRHRLHTVSRSGFFSPAADHHPGRLRAQAGSASLAPVLPDALEELFGLLPGMGLLMRFGAEALPPQSRQQWQRLATPLAPAPGIRLQPVRFPAGDGALRLLGVDLPLKAPVRFGVPGGTEPSVQTELLRRKCLLAEAAPACATLSHGYSNLRQTLPRGLDGAQAKN